eukprot:g13276.t1
MHGRIAEGSPLLGAAAPPMRGWGDAEREGSGRSLLGDGRGKSRRRDREGGAVSRSSSILRRNWKVSAGVAGVLMFSMALAGLVAIFSTIQGERTPRSASPQAQIKDMEATGPADESTAPAPDSGDRERLSDVNININIEIGGGQREERTDKEEEEEKDDYKKQEAKEGEETKSSGAGADQNKPNVFFIMIDDMGYNDIGYQSIDLQGVTPNLDKLAAGGIKMKEYYSMQICTPARASLMTGRYVVRYGLQYSVIQPGAPWGLPLNEKLFPQYMKDAGYETHMIGKWHIGSYTHHHIPSQRGFDTYLGYLNDEEMYWTHQSWTAKLHGRKFFDFGFGNATGYYDVIDRPIPDHLRNGSLTTEDDDHTMLSPTTTYSSSLSDSSDEETDFRGHYSTQVFQDRAIDILKDKTPHDEEPLYMYLSHQAVHDPLGLPPDGVFNDEELAILENILASSDDDGHLRQRFAKVLMYLDHTIGELVEYLTVEGWMENSIIVVASDNGGCPSLGGSNYPLRGLKHSYWEGGVKVPAFIYSESHIPEARRGTEYHGLMHVTDWLPTLASAAGFELEGSAGPLDGIDHWEYLVNTEFADSNDSPRQEMMYNFDPYILWADSDDSVGNAELNVAQGAYRIGNYKYLSKEVCSAWFTFDAHTNFEDPLTNVTTQCGGSACVDCGQSCTSYNTSDYLFDVVADPREENNLIFEYPEIAHNIRMRWVEVAFQEYTNSSYENIDRLAYYVWAKYNWWMVPWWNLVLGATEDPFGINGTDSTTTTSSSTPSSWTSSVSSSV